MRTYCREKINIQFSVGILKEMDALSGRGKFWNGIYSTRNEFAFILKRSLLLESLRAVSFMKGDWHVRKYSNASMTRNLPQLIQTRFDALGDFSDNSRKQIFRTIYDFFIFYYEHVCCVYSLESPRRCDSNEYTQHTIILYKIEKTSIY